jgi:nitrogen fixation protein NifX
LKNQGAEFDSVPNYPGTGMSETTLSRDIALRIGLAARALENTDAALLLRVLAEVIGLPPTEAKLAGLKPRQLKAALDGALTEQDNDALKSACAILSGKQIEAVELPLTEDYAAGDMPDSLRVACASNQGELINGHFGSCRYFLIYQVSADEMRLVDVREANESDVVDDKNAYRAALIEDTQVLFVASIGGPAAAKVVRAGVHPIKCPQGGEARDKLVDLQSKIAAAPPPWLAKAMGHAAESRVRFTRERLEN